MGTVLIFLEVLPVGDIMDDALTRRKVPLWAYTSPYILRHYYSGRRCNGYPYSTRAQIISAAVVGGKDIVCGEEIRFIMIKDTDTHFASTYAITFP